MRQWRFLLLLLPVLALQVGFMAAFRPFGVVPNLILVLAVLAGLMGTASLALGVALVGGLLLDLTSGADFGLRLGLLVLVALITGLVHRAGLTLAGSVVALVLVAAATVVGNLAVLVNLAGTAPHWPVGVILTKLGLEVVLNLSLTLAMRPLVKAVIARDQELLSIG